MRISCGEDDPNVFYLAIDKRNKRSIDYLSRRLNQEIIDFVYDDEKHISKCIVPGRYILDTSEIPFITADYFLSKMGTVL